MEFNYHIDEIRLQIAIPELLNRIRYHELQGTNTVEFDNGFYLATEHYKYDVYQKARAILNTNSWNQEMIGTHEIADRVLKAFRASSNLLHFMTNDFVEKVDADVSASERIIYDLFMSEDDITDQQVFENFVRYFGRNYSRTAYLYFLKDREKYLPIKPEFFAERFSGLNIYTDCCNGCTWNHYLEFIQIIRDIQNRIRSYFQKEISLLDAHSFVWSMYLLQDALDNYESDYKDYSNGQICVTKEQWKQVLLNREIFPEEYINLLGKFYLSENHAATCSDIAAFDGGHSSAYNSSVASMGRRVTDELQLPVLLRESGQRHLWPVLFYGRRLISGLFEWKMRPELAEAYGEVCSDTIQEIEIGNEKREATSTDDDTLLRKAQQRSEQNREFRIVMSEQKYRDPYIAEWAKRRAKGICLLCDEPAPFIDDKGKPYLEAHHIVWLSEGGKDSVQNVVALCPNCHRKMHVLKGTAEEQEWRQFLADCAEDYTEREKGVNKK